MTEVIEVRGAPEVAARLRKLGADFGAAAQFGAEQGAGFLRTYMQTNYLSGQRLGVISDKLRGGWAIRPLPGEVGAVLYTNTRYAPVHEYGFTGTENVKAHERERRKQPIQARKGKVRAARRAAKAGSKAAATGPIQVRAHTRDVNIRPKWFLRDTVAGQGRAALVIVEKQIVRRIQGQV